MHDAILIASSMFSSKLKLLRPSSLRSRARSWNWYRLIVSFWSCVSFVGLGASLIVFGPTLLDISSHLSVGVGVLAVMFTCRAIGSGVGSVSSGVIMDKYAGSSYMILSVITFSCITTTVVVPLSVHVALLGVFMFLNGIATGSLENGVHAVLMRLWGNKSGPCMQLLHFSWSFGAFVAPLIAKRFIRDAADEIVYNGTCSDIWNDTSISSESLTTPPGLASDDCFITFAEMCENLTDFTSYEGELFSFTDMNCTTSSNTEAPTDFKYAYFIAASLFLPSLIAFIYYSARRECFGRCCLKTVSLRNDSEKQETHNEDALSSHDKNGRSSLCYTIILFTFLFCFMFLYVGLEAGFGSLIFTVAVKGQLKFSKSMAAVLQSVYWGTFSFTRLFSVILALLNVRATIMIMGNLFGSFVASLIMIFYIHDPTAIWIGSAVLGMSYASIFPTAMTWMSENAKATGKATAVLVTAGTVGDITLPAVMGAVIAQVTPESLFYFTFVGVLISAGTAGVMFLTACLQKRRQLSQTVRGNPKVKAKYRQLASDNDPVLLEDSIEFTGVSEENCVNGSAIVETDFSENLNSAT